MRDIVPSFLYSTPAVGGGGGIGLSVATEGDIEDVVVWVKETTNNFYMWYNRNLKLAPSSDETTVVVGTSTVQYSGHALET